MPRSPDKRTATQNLEEKFDEGEVVLDYFDLSRARGDSTRIQHAKLLSSSHD